MDSHGEEVGHVHVASHVVGEGGVVLMEVGRRRQGGSLAVVRVRESMELLLLLRVMVVVVVHLTLLSHLLISWLYR